MNQTIPLQELRTQNKDVDTVFLIASQAILSIRRDPQLLIIRKQQPVYRRMPKQAQEFMEYQGIESTFLRTNEHDRVFNLETVEIKGFNTKHKTDIDTAILHSGPSADEFARSLNALAVTIGTNIYFRNGAYKPETEEGRKLLAHELTHVAQHTEKRITSMSTREELETEASEAEKKEVYDPDPFISLQIGNGTYKMRRSEIPELATMVANEIEERIKAEKGRLTEEEYLRLLCSYYDLLEEGRLLHV